MHQCPTCKEDCRCDDTDIRLNDFDECTHCVLDEDELDDDDEDLDDPFDDEPDEDDDLDEDDDDESDDEDEELVHGGESGSA